MDFELQPTLQGERLHLRPLQPEDFEPLFAAAKDPRIWEQHPEPDRHLREVFQRYFDGGLASRGALVAIDRGSGRMIGSSRFHDLKPEDGEVEIGYTFLERAYWGGAHNGELKRLMLDHAFRFVKRVVFVIGETNLRSQKAIEKIGASLQGRVERLDRNGGPRPNLIFGISREDWLRRA
jgi:N-acetyltransferase